MALRIHTNLLALRSNNHLEQTNERVATRLRRIGSGLRIAIAADDPQGLARSEKLRARIRSNDAAIRNVEDGIGLVRTLESGLGQMADIGARLRQLALAASNGTASAEDIAALDNERLHLGLELSRIASATTYNGKKVLGVSETVPIHVGLGPDDVVGVDLIDFTPVGLVFSFYSLADEEEGLEQIHEYSGVLVDTLTEIRGFLGAMENRFSSILRNLRASEETLASEDSHIRDADFAIEVSELSRERIRQGLGALLTARANVNHGLARELLEDITSLAPASRRNDDEVTPFGLDPIGE